MSIEQIKEFLHQFKVVTDANFLGISLDNLIQLYVRQYGVHPNPTQLRSHICTALVNTFGSNCIGKFRDKKINKQNKKYCRIAPYDQSLVPLEENDYFSVNTLQETIDHTLKDHMVCTSDNTSLILEPIPA